MTEKKRVLIAYPLKDFPESKDLIKGISAAIEPLAYLGAGYKAIPDAVLGRMKASGRLVEWRFGAVRMIDQERGKALLVGMEERQRKVDEIMTADSTGADVPEESQTTADLAELAKKFAKECGNAKLAAQLLGMSSRTYEGIAQGKGFRYPQLFVLAIQAFHSTLD